MVPQFVSYGKGLLGNGGNLQNICILMEFLYHLEVNMQVSIYIVFLVSDHG